MILFFKPPKNDKNFFWTKHAQEKMRYYQLSESRIKNLFYHYQRQEEGIVPGTIARMQTVGSRRRPTEIWMMGQPDANQPGRIKIITVWRYPGISKEKEVPVPEEIKKLFSQRFETQ
jgi:hypothetical protein